MLQHGTVGKKRCLLGKALDPGTIVRRRRGKENRNSHANSDFGSWIGLVAMVQTKQYTVWARLATCRLPYSRRHIVKSQNPCPVQGRLGSFELRQSTVRTSAMRQSRLLPTASCPSTRCRSPPYAGEWSSAAAAVSAVSAILSSKCSSR